MPPVEQELTILQRHPSFPPVFSGVHDAQSLVFCVVLYRLLFVLSSFFFCSLHYLFFVDYPFGIFKLFPSTDNKFMHLLLQQGYIMYIVSHFCVHTRITITLIEMSFILCYIITVNVTICIIFWYGCFFNILWFLSICQILYYVFIICHTDINVSILQIDWLIVVAEKDCSYNHKRD